MLLPQVAAPVVVGHREVDHGIQPASEGLIQVRTQVRGQDGDAIEQLHALEQVRNLDIGVSIMGVLDVRALAEHRVRLVEQQHTVDAIRLGEDAVEVLLRLTDVLVDDRRQVDDIQVQAKVVGHDFRGHRFSRARVAREQGRQAATLDRGAAHAPGIEDQVPIASTRGQLVELHRDLVGEHQVAPM